jgi:hypothetical protein
LELLEKDGFMVNEPARQEAASPIRFFGRNGKPRLLFDAVMKTAG